MKRPLYIIILALVFSCSKEDSIDSNSPDSKQEYSAEIAGAIAKGAYKAGSDITFYELNDNLSQTGKSFSTNTTDDYGTFSLSVESITENYARVEGNGYYWNEITNTVTEQKLRLNAICEVNEEINLNILTHLEYDRVIELVQNQGKTFAEAKTQALSEVLSSFGIEYDSINGNAEAYNFNKADDSSKLLLLVSVAILHNKTQSESSELIAQISNDLKDNGKINNSTIYQTFIDNLNDLYISESNNFEKISQNLHNFYDDLNSEIESSSFFIDIDIENIVNQIIDYNQSAIEGGNELYFDENGVTIKANIESIEAGETYELNGESYKVVDSIILKEMIDNNKDISKVVTTLVEDMSSLLEGKNDFNQDISSWDVSNVGSFRNMFSGLETFNQDLSFWDVSNATHMSHMFIEAISFNSDISKWDVSNVLNFDCMFCDAHTFNQDLTAWDVSKALDCFGFNNNAFNFEESNLPNFEICSIEIVSDIDNDGVRDLLDLCPNTQSGVNVNSDGCADQDNDGVPDIDDLCAYTQNGVNVNTDGCADQDNDGVPDTDDLCPNTPYGTTVTSNGCYDTNSGIIFFGIGEAYVEGDVFSIPFEPELYSMFVCPNFLYNPLIFDVNHRIVFSASSADKDVELSFQFVSESNDGTESYTTESIIVSGASEIQYTVTIPVQEGKSYNYIYLEFLNVDDVRVTIKDIKIEPVP